MVIGLPELFDVAHRAHVMGREIVLTGGIYDILTLGHLRHLEEARMFGDLLIVEMGDDALAQAAKGPGRPIQPIGTRSALVASLKPVDHVVIVHSEGMKHDIIRALSPCAYVRGSEYTHGTMPEADLVESLGGSVAFTAFHGVEHDSDLINRVRHLDACSDLA